MLHFYKIFSDSKAQCDCNRRTRFYLVLLTFHVVQSIAELSTNTVYLKQHGMSTIEIKFK